MKLKKKAVTGGYICQSERLTEGRVYVLTGPWSDEYRQYIDGKDVVGIRLSRSAGWKCEGIEFIGDLPCLRSVEIYHWDVKDISILFRQSSLEHIGLECQYKNFDFTNFQRLSYCGVRWRPGSESLLDCKGLKYLSIDNYPYENLKSLHQLVLLERIVIRSRKLLCCEGIQTLVRLADAHFNDCSSLFDIKDFKRGENEKLKNLSFSSCNKIFDIGSIGALQSLKRLLIENCKTINSVKALQACIELEELFLIGTKVEDGDLSPLLNMKKLKKVAIARGKNHSHTSEEINKHLSGA